MKELLTLHFANPSVLYIVDEYVINKVYFQRRYNTHHFDGSVATELPRRVAVKILIRAG